MMKCVSEDRSVCDGSYGMYIIVTDIENIFVFSCFCIINITCLKMKLSYICFIVTG
jgi:hypothetical protein